MNRGIEILRPASYLGNSNWLFEESKDTKWTPEENKRFENALALFDKDTPDRWYNVAAMIPGKTVNDVIKQYRELVEDVTDIEAGLIPIPGYASNSFTLEWVNNSQGFDGLKQFHGTAGKRGSSARPPDQERKKGVAWSEEEHRQFLMGLKKYGKGDWRNIARNFVTTRTPTQVASHAQKYFIRQLSGAKDKRRSSIHDITTVNLNDTKSPSPGNHRPPQAQDHSTMATQSQQHTNMNNLAKELDAPSSLNHPQYQGAAMPCNLPSSGSLIVTPPRGSRTLHRSKLHGQNPHKDTLHEPHLVPYSTFFKLESTQHEDGNSIQAVGGHCPCSTMS